MVQILAPKFQIQVKRDSCNRNAVDLTRLLRQRGKKVEESWRNFKKVSSCSQFSVKIPGKSSMVLHLCPGRRLVRVSHYLWDNVSLTETDIQSRSPYPAAESEAGSEPGRRQPSKQFLIILIFKMECTNEDRPSVLITTLITSLLSPDVLDQHPIHPCRLVCRDPHKLQHNSSTRPSQVAAPLTSCKPS